MSFFTLAQAVEGARESLEQTYDLDSNPGIDHREDAIGIASGLRRIVDELEQAPAVDERSTAIKRRIVELINNRAKAFQQAMDDKAIAAASRLERDVLEAAFNDFTEWRQSAFEEFRDLFTRER